MSEQPVYVAVRARRYHDKRGDGLEVYLRNGPDDAWVRVGDAADDFTAPWLSREEQEMILRAMGDLLVHANCPGCIADDQHEPDCALDAAIALMQSRLHPEEIQQ